MSRIHRCRSSNVVGLRSAGGRVRWAHARPRTDGLRSVLATSRVSRPRSRRIEDDDAVPRFAARDDGAPDPVGPPDDVPARRCRPLGRREAWGFDGATARRERATALDRVPYPSAAAELETSPVAGPSEAETHHPNPSGSIAEESVAISSGVTGRLRVAGHRDRRFVEAVLHSDTTGRLGDLHLVFAVLWCIALPISRSAESILFVALLVVSVLRGRRLLGVYQEVVFTVPALAMVAWSVLVGVVAMSNGDLGDPTAQLPTRMLLLPLMLSPVVHRWRLLLLALACGAAVVTAGLVVENGMALARGGGGARHQTRPTDLWGLGLLIALGIALMSRSGVPRLLGSIVVTGVVLAASLGSQRAGMVGSAVGTISMVVLRGRGLVPFNRPKIAAGVILCGLVVAGASVWLSWSSGAAASKRLGAEDLNAYSTGRLDLWETTLELSWQRPWCGHGPGAWRTAIATREPESTSTSRTRDLVRRTPDLEYAHNLFVDLFFESGAIGVCLWIFGLSWGVVTGLSRMRREPTLAIAFAGLASVLLIAQFDHPLARGVSAGFYFALATLCLVPRPDQQSFESAGLGIEDRWIDRLLSGGPWPR